MEFSFGRDLGGIVTPEGQGTRGGLREGVEVGRGGTP